MAVDGMMALPKGEAGLEGDQGIGTKGIAGYGWQAERWTVGWSLSRV